MSLHRLVQAEQSGTVDALADLLKVTARPVIVVGFVRPYADLRSRLEAAGVNLAGIFFVDCTSNPNLAAFSPDAFFIGSPSMLERIGIVCTKVLPRLGGSARIIIHDHESVSAYNGAELTQQFMQQLLAESHRNGSDVDVLLQSIPPALGALADEQVALEALA